MATVVAGIDDSTERAKALVSGILSIPMNEELTVVLIHSFDENREGASVDQVASVRRAREELIAEGVEVLLDEASGDTAGSIINAGEQHDADIIVTAGRKRSPTGKAIFGSVSQDVILGTDRPVLVCGNNG